VTTNVPPLLRRVAAVQIAYGVLGLLAAGGMAILVAASPPAVRARATSAEPLLLVVTQLLPAFAAGVALRRGSAWSGLLLTLAGTLQLFFVPLGTALGAWTLWALRRAARTGATRDRSDAGPRDVAPRAPVAYGRTAEWQRAPFELLPEPSRTAPLLAAIACTGLGFVALLAIGFAVAGDPVPAEAVAIAGPAIAALLRVLQLAGRARRSQATTGVD
jgi:hypothetical protein